MISRDVGRQILEQRRLRGLGQAELARAACVSRTVVSRLESGRGEPVQSDVIDRLAQGLGVSAGIVLGTPQPSQRAIERLHQDLRREQLRSRHFALAARLAATDERRAAKLLSRARAQVDLWRSRRTCSHHYIDRWSAVLSQSPRKAAEMMTNLREWENALFQNSPWSFAWN